MIQKMRNIISVKIFGTDVNLTGATNIKCYVSLNSNNFSYNGNVVAGTVDTVYFEVPYADAMKLETGCADVQVCYTDSDNTPRATDAIHADVKRMIAPEGYQVS